MRKIEINERMKILDCNEGDGICEMRGIDINELIKIWLRNRGSERIIERYD